MARPRGVTLALLAAACLVWISSSQAAAALTSKRYADTTVHLVISCHLDVGFTDLDASVLDAYFHQHLPRAVRLAKEWAVSPLNSHGIAFRYMTHSWLLSLFLDCPHGMDVTCPNATEVASVRQAIKDGVLTWHAVPFNPQYEVFDASLLRAALDLTHALDERFGQPHKAMASLRDVPGLTRGAIPVFASAGVQGITGGVNSFSAPPGVPKNAPFVWRDVDSGTQLLAMWHPGGYSGYVNGTGVDTRADCVKAAGFRHVLCASWRGDNAGPPDSLEELSRIVNITASQWPGAALKASSPDEYLAELLKAVEGGLELPVITGEIGDTWIHGIGSDPVKMADLRAFMRARVACEADPACDSTSAAYLNSSRLLMKAPEHTWGISVNQFLGDFTNFTNAYLHAQLRREPLPDGFALTLKSWTHQRLYIDWALQALPSEHPVRAAVQADRAERQGHHALTARRLRAQGAVPLLASPAGEQAPAAVHATAAAAAATAAAGACPATTAESPEDLTFCSHAWLLRIDPVTGGLLQLQRLYSRAGETQLGNDWAAPRARRSEAPTSAWRRLLGSGHGSSCAPPRWQRRQQHGQPTAASQGRGRRGCQPLRRDASHFRGDAVAAARAAGAPALAEWSYDVFNLQEFGFVWANYQYPNVTWDGDFGKWNLSHSCNLSAQALPRLVQVYHSHDEATGLMLHLQLAFPRQLVLQAGAPAIAWLVLHSPPGSDALLVTAAWQSKTPTRLPEAIWLRFKPARGAVDDASWVAHKLGSTIRPHEIILNGSHSLHAVSEAGVSVLSPDHSERLAIASRDVPLVALGTPNPLPNPCDGPDMREGVAFNPFNNIWGTNYAMWWPFDKQDEAGSMFRFTLQAQQVGVGA